MTDVSSSASDQSLFLRIASFSTSAVAEEGRVLTTPFLAACGEILPIVDRLGTAFALVRSDVNGNIVRLKNRQLTNPTEFSDLFEMLRVEVQSQQQGSSQSATLAVLWLKRAMEFVVSLLLRLCGDESLSLSTAANDAYNNTLYQYHNWVTASAFFVVLKMVPTREAFFEKFDMPTPVAIAQIKVCIEQISPMLAAVGQHLLHHGLDTSG